MSEWDCCSENCASGEASEMSLFCSSRFAALCARLELRRAHAIWRSTFIIYRLAKCVIIDLMLSRVQSCILLLLLRPSPLDGKIPHLGNVLKCGAKVERGAKWLKTRQQH